MAYLHYLVRRLAPQRRPAAPWLRRVVAALSIAAAGVAAAQTPGAGAAAARSAVDLPTRLDQVLRDARLFEQAWKTGRKVAAVCANCHGEGGNSTKPDIPNLAAQNPAYLLEQVRQFADGRRRNEFMQGLIRAMNDEERVAMVVYYSNQPVTPQPVRDAALVAQGKSLYERNCFRCHGADGHGGEQFARVAGQQPDYLLHTLKAYRDGSANRRDPLMAASTMLLKDPDLRALVAYVSSMK